MPKATQPTSQDRQPPGSRLCRANPATARHLLRTKRPSLKWPRSDLHITWKMGPQDPPHCAGVTPERPHQCRAVVPASTPGPCPSSLLEILNCSPPQEPRSHPCPAPEHSSHQELVGRSECIPEPSRAAPGPAFRHSLPPPAPHPPSLLRARPPWRGCQRSISAHSLYENASEGPGVAIWS